EAPLLPPAVLCCSAGSVILESPDLSVMEGDDVTLRCRNKMPSFDLSADFYKDDVLIRSSDTGNMSIHSISKSHEGCYKCNMSGAGESAERQLTVTGEELQFCHMVQFQITKLKFLIYAKCELYFSLRQSAARRHGGHCSPHQTV
uniref:Ig-like domain-containing protein n=1 Tax=Seriola lalandi dorsalis TaxID=1841481 RepID=A0A3B4YFB6_SERLL